MWLIAKRDFLQNLRWQNEVLGVARTSLDRAFQLPLLLLWELKNVARPRKADIILSLTCFSVSISGLAGA